MKITKYNLVNGRTANKPILVIDEEYTKLGVCYGSNGSITVVLGDDKAHTRYSMVLSFPEAKTLHDALGKLTIGEIMSNDKITLDNIGKSALKS